MTRALITFSGSDYDSTTEALTHAEGVDEVWVYDDTWLIQQPFYELNKWIFEHQPRRCFGYCSWKSFIILEALKHADTVFYVDADCRPVSSLAPIFDIAERDGACLFMACGHRQRQWCKRECYEVMAQEKIDAQAGCARFASFKRNDWRATQFLYEWLTYSVNRKANTKVTSQPWHEDFIEHRDEQAIMTNLAHRYGFKLHRECDQTGEDPTFRHMDRELYPQLFEMIHQTKGSNGQGSRFRRVP